VNTPQDAAQILCTLRCLYVGHLTNSRTSVDEAHRLSLQSGTLFGVPIPEKYAAAAGKIQDAVEQAIRESEENGMSRRGNNVTPWLLGRVHELTKGGSLESSTNSMIQYTNFDDANWTPCIDIALIENTAVVGALVGVHFIAYSYTNFNTGSQIAVKYAELLKNRGEQSPNHV
jgi:hypothetical protein